MTADCRTIRGKLRLFCADKNDTRLDFLGIVHINMNLVVELGKMGRGAALIFRIKNHVTYVIVEVGKKLWSISQ